MPPGYCTGELQVGRQLAGDVDLWLKTSGPFSLQTSCCVSVALVLCFL